MFNITSDIHIDMYYHTNIPKFKQYDYIMGNTDALSEKLKDTVRMNVDNYIYSMIKNTDEIEDTLIISGDIANNNTYSKEFLIKASSIWKNVWYTDGNHEYYFQDKDSGDNRLYKLIEDLKDYPNIKYVANTVQEIKDKEKTLKIGFLPLMYNMNNPKVRYIFNHKMNDKHFITQDYLYESYEKGYSFYENEIYGKCDICVSHVPVLKLEGTRGNETTYFTKLKLDPSIIYFFGHTHKNEEVTNYITQEDGSEACVKGYNIGVGYPPDYGRGVGIPHLRTFKWLEKENKLTEISCNIEQNKTDLEQENNELMKKYARKFIRLYNLEYDGDVNYSHVYRNKTDLEREIKELVKKYVGKIKAFDILNKRK